MASLRSFLEEAGRGVDGLRAFSLVSRLAGLHRVQGGEDIIEAARLVAGLLEESGVEARLHVLEGRLGLERSWFFWEPSGWRLVYAEVEKKTSAGWERVASTRDHPLVGIVHSPGGFGEGEAVLVSPTRGGEEDSFSGKVPVMVGFESDKYYRLVERGAEAVIATHTGPGIRYYGLFPFPGESPGAPAASLELGRAVGLDGVRVRVSVEAEYREPVTPIVYARVGVDEPSILLVAHICHPSPGAHDNASGVAVVVEVLRALKNLEGVLRRGGVSVEALFVPEYTGTAAAFQAGVVEASRVLAALSIDMVGSRLDATGGSLNYYSSLYTLPSLLDMYTYYSLWLSHEHVEGFDSPGYPLHGVHLLPYSRGSDHDIAVAMGIPAGLVNEWPDRYYHTSLDSPENLSPANLASTARAVAAAVARTAKTLEDGKWREALDAWTGEITARTASQAAAGLVSGEAGSAAVEARAKALEAGAARIEGVLGRRRGVEQPWRIDVETVARRGPISKRYLERFYRNTARLEPLRRLPEKERRIYTGIVALALQATRSSEAAALEAVASRHRRVRREVVAIIADLVAGGI